MDSKRLTNKVSFMYLNLTIRNPELEVQGLVLIYFEEIKAMKALHYEGAGLMAFLFCSFSVKLATKASLSFLGKNNIPAFAGMAKRKCIFEASHEGFGSPKKRGEKKILGGI